MSDNYVFKNVIETNKNLLNYEIYFKSRIDRHSRFTYFSCINIHNIQYMYIHVNIFVTEHDYVMCH